MRRATTWLFLSLAAGPLVASQAATQEPERASANDRQRVAPDRVAALDLAPVDSQEVLKKARSGQTRFERIRRHHLPWTWDGAGHRCDERVGRFCLWHDDNESFEPGRERDEIRAAREELTAELGRAARLLPGDEWIAGQRVRYLIEAGRFRDGLDAATECRAANAWWCSALAGYALHAGGDFPGADSAFTEALRAMPQADRCRWTDISLFLDGDSKRRYRRLPCEERDSLENRFWWLADPLYLSPANDRRTEHLARWVIDRTQERASSTFGLGWGSDLRELLLRYGWPTGWERARSRSIQRDGRPSILAHHAPQGRQFLPPKRALEDPTSIPAEEWRLDPITPRTEYAPAYAELSDSLEHQLAVFRRGDSAIIVAAYDVNGNEAWSEGQVEAALILAPDERSPATVATHKSVGGKGVLSAAIESKPTLLSLELVSAGAKQAARARYGIPLHKKPRLVLAVSDLLILAEGDSLADSLPHAIPHARGSLRMRPGEPVRFFWEVYGLGPEGEELSISLKLIKESRGWLRKVGESIGLAGRDQPVSLEWLERPGAGTGIWPRWMALALPDLSAGVYTLKLEISAFGREPVSSSRSLVVDN